MQSSDDSTMVHRLRRGDSLAFRELVTAHQSNLQRLARTFVPSDAVAQEAVQETWIAVIRGIDRFEQRSSLKTWITRILVNTARTKGAKERRTLPFASLDGDEGDQPAVSPDRFIGPSGRGTWADPPTRWSDAPENVAMSNTTIALVVETINRLPDQQKWVVMLRDVEDWASSDVCDVLGISESNQRVLLHRGRSSVRATLERHLGGES